MTMKCISCCSCDTYNIKELHIYFKNHKNYPVCKLYDNNEVLHLQHVTDNNTHLEIFLFAYGCIVLWGCDEEFTLKFIDYIKKYSVRTLHSTVIECDLYKISDTNETYIEGGTDVMHIEDGNASIMLTFSYGLSQSVKLITFEDSVARTIEENKGLPFELMNTGKTSLSRISLAKKIGSLFAKRHLINLNSSILDTPEFFWKRPKYEPYYKMIIENLELVQRIKVLNDRLNIIHELYNILSDELQHTNSSRLEWIIIFLILFEVVLSIMRDIPRLF